MDTPGKSNAGEVEKGYALHVNTDGVGERDTVHPVRHTHGVGERDTSCTSILLMLVV